MEHELHLRQFSSVIQLWKGLTYSSIKAKYSLRHSQAFVDIIFYNDASADEKIQSVRVALKLWNQAPPVSKPKYHKNCFSIWYKVGECLLKVNNVFLACICMIYLSKIFLLLTLTDTHMTQKYVVCTWSGYFQQDF